MTAAELWFAAALSGPLPDLLGAARSDGLVRVLADLLEISEWSNRLEVDVLPAGMEESMVSVSVWSESGGEWRGQLLRVQMPWSGLMGRLVG